jgi:histone H3/H4
MEKQVKRKSTKKAAPKREGAKRAHRSVRGIKLGSAVKAMKSGVPKHVRLSEKAVDYAIQETEVYLKEIARECKELLQLTEKKTVTIKLLLLALKRLGVNKNDILMKAVLGAQKEKGQDIPRSLIAVASVHRVFAEELPLGQKEFRMSKNAGVALSKLAEAALRKFGEDGYVLAENAKRKTIKQRDVMAATVLRC